MYYKPLIDVGTFEVVTFDTGDRAQDLDLSLATRPKMAYRGIFDQDALGKSNCNGDCVASWPPLAAKSGDVGVDEWTVIARDDGTHQWAFRGHPLYTFVKDTVPGEVNGNGAAGFHLAD